MCVGIRRENSRHIGKQSLLCMRPPHPWAGRPQPMAGSSVRLLRVSSMRASKARGATSIWSTTRSSSSGRSLETALHALNVLSILSLQKLNAEKRFALGYGGGRRGRELLQGDALHVHVTLRRRRAERREVCHARRLPDHLPRRRTYREAIRKVRRLRMHRGKRRQRRRRNCFQQYASLLITKSQ